MRELAAATTADSRHATLLEPGHVLEGRFRYQLERNLGSGGFGSVYLARCLDADSGRPDAPPAEVAVKLLGPAHDPSARSFLKREVSALLAVEHDRIPKLYDWSLQGEDNFVVLEYFAEGSLADARSSISRLDEDQTWRLLTDLLSALSAAHRASILHLDVKPSNVLLDGEGGYILTDFGVSQGSRMSKGLLHQGQIPIGLGTHGYRAPEQDSTRVQTFDLRTDLWGVGVTAWSMYTGIDLNKRHDVLRTGVPGNIYGLPRLSDVHLRCPPPLEEVVMGLLTIQPSARPGGTAEVLSQIRAIASGFGMPSQAVASAHRNEASAAEAQQVVDDLADPLWASICRAPGFQRFLVRYEDGALISGNGEQAHNALLLLRGAVAVEKRGQRVGVEEREGTILGAIATLTDAPRSVTLRAQGETWVCVFNEAELEQLLTSNPAVALRMIRTFANRIVAGPPRHRD
jgi:serine/threonine protein kinase